MSNIAQDNSELLAEIDELKWSLTQRMDEFENLSIQHEELRKENDRLNHEVRFLQGQIEAYQYCMNYRR